MYKEGFSIFDDLSISDQENFYNLRSSEVKRMLEMQFVLATYSNISTQDTDKMTPFEIENMFEFLKKKNELEAQRNRE